MEQKKQGQVWRVTVSQKDRCQLAQCCWEVTWVELSEMGMC